MNVVTVFDITKQEYDKVTIARLLVGLASQCGVRDLVLKMLVKDIVDAERFVRDVRVQFNLK